MVSEPKRTESSHTTEEETGTHVFRIIGYTLNKGRGVGNSIQSGIFTVGGYDWAIRFYPDGTTDATKDYVAVSLVLVSKNAEVRASYDLTFVNQTTWLPDTVLRGIGFAVFRSRSGNFLIPRIFKEKRDRLECKSAGFIVDDCLKIQCTITVAKESWVETTTGVFKIEVPDSDLQDQFGKLLSEKEGADVTFSVGGETFPAHKIVLATRSPVFKAQLYGQMKESRAPKITVEDMQPDVFKALLKFIYTDSLPADWDDLGFDEYCEIAKLLLVAADRYAMDRLKLLCASILVKYLHVENVATTLALADQHNCDRLKEVCIEFMTSSDEIDAVVKTEGYATLKRTCPSILLDALEKRSKYRKT